MKISSISLYIVFFCLLIFSNSSFSKTFFCRAEDYLGNTNIIEIKKKQLNYTMIWKGRDIPLRLIINDYKYVVLYVNAKHLTFLIGINKEKGILKFDIMDLDNNRKRTRIEGKCLIE